MVIDGLIYESSLMVMTLDGLVIKHVKSKGIENDGPQLKWDGKDEFGNDVGTGMYFYSIKVGTFRDDKKMILIK